MLSLVSRLIFQFNPAWIMTINEVYLALFYCILVHSFYFILYISCTGWVGELWWEIGKSEVADTEEALENVFVNKERGELILIFLLEYEARHFVYEWHIITPYVCAMADIFKVCRITSRDANRNQGLDIERVREDLSSIEVDRYIAPLPARSGSEAAVLWPCMRFPNSHDPHGYWSGKQNLYFSGDPKG